MKQKKKNKITRQQEQLLAAIKHCKRKKPIPRPAVFATKKDYSRQAQKSEARKQCEGAY